MDYIIFDLDNTLYPADRELFPLIDKRINRYMHERIGIPIEDVDGLRRRYWLDYGITLQGLIRHFAVDPEDYLTYVHDVDVASRLCADPTLAALLAALPQRKGVFTNGSLCHAERVLGTLGVRDLFEHVFDIRIGGYQPKLYNEPYRQVLAAIDVAPARCVMVEDTLDNLNPAKELGMTTLWLATAERETPSFVDARIDSLDQIAAVLDRLAQERGA